jgi:hypothetical protein
MDHPSTSGVCKLCGKHGPLTKEHIPAKGGYKGTSYRVQVLGGDKVLEGGRGDHYQRGFHTRALCEDCNNNTGSWYGDEFARWTKWGLKLLDEMRKPKPSLVPLYDGFPVRIAKQVVSTMIASASEGFAAANPHLRNFVLDRHRTLSPDELRLTTYLCPTRTGRSTGVAAVMNLMQEESDPHVLIEFALQPFGYVLTLGGEPLDTRPVSIAWFASCRYGEGRVVDLPHIPILPTHEAIPCDYRTRYEIRRDVIVNILMEQHHPTPHEEAVQIMESGKGPEFFAVHGEDWSLDFTTGLAPYQSSA